MSDPINIDQFREIVCEHAEEIDECLDDVGMPIIDRPFSAAFLFVDVAVLDSTFDSKDELLNSDVFSKCIVPIFFDWYRERYGDLVNSQDKGLAGIVHYRGQPIEVCFPGSTSQVERAGETAWLMFPIELQDDERAQEFIVPNVDVDALDEGKQAVLKSEISDVVGLTRQIRLNLMTAAGLEPDMQAMARGILGHIQKAISDILSLAPSTAAVGCWELHLALEKAFKVYIHAHTGVKVRGHDLSALNERAKSSGLSVDESDLSSLPSADDAIQMRYGEMTVLPATAAAHYGAALRLLAVITSGLKRKYNIENARFLIQKPPWAG